MGETFWLSPGMNVALLVSFEGIELAEGALVLEAWGEEVRIPLSTAEAPRCARLNWLDEARSLGLGCRQLVAEIDWACEERAVRTIHLEPDGGFEYLFVAEDESEAAELWLSLSREEGFHLGLEGRPRAFVAFDNGDALWVSTPVRVASEVIRLEDDPREEGTTWSWELRELPPDRDGNGSLDEADGFEVWLRGRRLPPVTTTGAVNWHIDPLTGTIHLSLIVWRPDDADVPEVRWPVLCESDLNR